MLNALFNSLRAPKRSRFQTSHSGSDGPASTRFSSRIELQSLTHELSHSPFTRPLFMRAANTNGRSLRFIQKPLPPNCNGEYDFGRNEVITNSDVMPTRVVVSHELRHAWQDAVYNRQQYLAADPYTHFFYRQIMEADAVAFGNFVHDATAMRTQNPDKDLPISYLVDQYKQDFMSFLDGKSLKARDGKLVDPLHYRYEHLRSSALNGQPFSWVFGKLQKYQTPLAQPEKIDDVIYGLKLFDANEDPIYIFTREEAENIRRQLCAIHRQNNVTGPKLDMISEDLYGHYSFTLPR